jgi:hypothetical protein
MRNIERLRSQQLVRLFGVTKEEGGMVRGCPLRLVQDEEELNMILS